MLRFGTISTRCTTTRGRRARSEMRKKVVVIGGGVAGMSAAQELIERGFAVEVLDGERSPEGRLAASPCPAPGSGAPRARCPGSTGFDSSLASTSTSSTRWAESPAETAPSPRTSSTRPRSCGAHRALSGLLSCPLPADTRRGVWRDSLRARPAGERARRAGDGDRTVRREDLPDLSSCEERRQSEYEKSPGRTS